MITKRTVLAIVVAIALALGVAPATGASASPADPIQVQDALRMNNANSNQCLVVRTGRADAPAVQTSCMDYADQYWERQYVRQSADGYPLHRIQGDAFGQCLTVRGHVRGTQAVQFPCYDYADQLWIQWDVGNGNYQYQNNNSRQCLLVRGDAREAPVVQDTCSLLYRDQFWYWAAG